MIQPPFLLSKLDIRITKCTKTEGLGFRIQGIQLTKNIFMCKILKLGSLWDTQSFHILQFLFLLSLKSHCPYQGQNEFWVGSYELNFW